MWSLKMRRSATDPNIIVRPNTQPDQSSKPKYHAFRWESVDPYFITPSIYQLKDILNDEFGMNLLQTQNNSVVVTKSVNKPPSVNDPKRHSVINSFIKALCGNREEGEPKLPKIESFQLNSNTCPPPTYSLEPLKQMIFSPKPQNDSDFKTVLLDLGQRGLVLTQWRLERIVKTVPKVSNINVKNENYDNHFTLNKSDPRIDTAFGPNPIMMPSHPKQSQGAKVENTIDTNNNSGQQVNRHSRLYLPGGVVADDLWLKSASVDIQDILPKRQQKNIKKDCALQKDGYDDYDSDNSDSSLSFSESDHKENSVIPERIFDDDGTEWILKGESESSFIYECPSRISSCLHRFLHLSTFHRFIMRYLQDPSLSEMTSQMAHIDSLQRIAEELKILSQRRQHEKATHYNEEDSNLVMCLLERMQTELFRSSPEVLKSLSEFTGLNIFDENCGFEDIEDLICIDEFCHSKDGDDAAAEKNKIKDEKGHIPINNNHQATTGKFQNSSLLETAMSGCNAIQINNSNIVASSANCACGNYCICSASSACLCCTCAIDHVLFKETPIVVLPTLNELLPSSHSSSFHSSSHHQSHSHHSHNTNNFNSVPPHSSDNFSVRVTRPNLNSTNFNNNSNTSATHHLTSISPSPSSPSIPISSKNLVNGDNMVIGDNNHNKIVSSNKTSLTLPLLDTKLNSLNLPSHSNQYLSSLLQNNNNNSNNTNNNINININNNNTNNNSNNVNMMDTPTAGGVSTGGMQLSPTASSLRGRFLLLSVSPPPFNFHQATTTTNYNNNHNIVNGYNSSSIMTPGDGFNLASGMSTPRSPHWSHGNNGLHSAHHLRNKMSRSVSSASSARHSGTSPLQFQGFLYFNRHDKIFAQLEDGKVDLKSDNINDHKSNNKFPRKKDDSHYPLGDTNILHPPSLLTAPPLCKSCIAALSSAESELPSHSCTFSQQSSQCCCTLYSHPPIHINPNMHSSWFHPSVLALVPQSLVQVIVRPTLAWTHSWTGCKLMSKLLGVGSLIQSSAATSTAFDSLAAIRSIENNYNSSRLLNSLNSSFASFKQELLSSSRNERDLLNVLIDKLCDTPCSDSYVGKSSDVKLSLKFSQNVKVLDTIFSTSSSLVSSNILPSSTLNDMTNVNSVSLFEGIPAAHTQTVFIGIPDALSSCTLSSKLQPNSDKSGQNASLTEDNDDDDNSTDDVQLLKSSLTDSMSFLSSHPDYLVDEIGLEIASTMARLEALSFSNRDRVKDAMQSFVEEGDAKHHAAWRLITNVTSSLVPIATVHEGTDEIGDKIDWTAAAGCMINPPFCSSSSSTPAKTSHAKALSDGYSHHHSILHHTNDLSNSISLSRDVCEVELVQSQLMQLSKGAHRWGLIRRNMLLGLRDFDFDNSHGNSNLSGGGSSGGENIVEVVAAEQRKGTKQVFAVSLPSIEEDEEEEQHLNNNNNNPNFTNNNNSKMNNKHRSKKNDSDKQQHNKKKKQILSLPPNPSPSNQTSPVQTPPPPSFGKGKTISSATSQAEPAPLPSPIQDSYCSVCFGTLLDPIDPLVVCKGCGLCVHASCFPCINISSLPALTTDFLCPRCDRERITSTIAGVGGNSNLQRVCVACKRPGGAMKRVSVVGGAPHYHNAAGGLTANASASGGHTSVHNNCNCNSQSCASCSSSMSPTASHTHASSSIHLSCAIWLMPLAVCLDLERMEPWDLSQCWAVHGVHPSLVNLHGCFICGLSEGLLVRCGASNDSAVSSVRAAHLTHYYGSSRGQHHHASPFHHATGDGSHQPGCHSATGGNSNSSAPTSSAGVPVASLPSSHATLGSQHLRVPHIGDALNLDRVLFHSAIISQLASHHASSCTGPSPSTTTHHNTDGDSETPPLLPPSLPPVSFPPSLAPLFGLALPLSSIVNETAPSLLRPIPPPKPSKSLSAQAAVVAVQSLAILAYCSSTLPQLASAFPTDDDEAPAEPVGDCSRVFHPMCAWLGGLFVDACENVAEPLHIRGVPNAAFPSLSISCFCPAHTPIATRFSRHRSHQSLIRTVQLANRESTPALFHRIGRRAMRLVAAPLRPPPPPSSLFCAAALMSTFQQKSKQLQDVESDNNNMKMLLIKSMLSFDERMQAWCNNSGSVAMYDSSSVTALRVSSLIDSINSHQGGSFSKVFPPHLLSSPLPAVSSPPVSSLLPLLVSRWTPPLTSLSRRSVLAASKAAAVSHAKKGRSNPPVVPPLKKKPAAECFPDAEGDVCRLKGQTAGGTARKRQSGIAGGGVDHAPTSNYGSTVAGVHEKIKRVRQLECDGSSQQQFLNSRTSSNLKESNACTTKRRHLLQGENNAGLTGTEDSADIDENMEDNRHSGMCDNSTTHHHHMNKNTKMSRKNLKRNVSNVSSSSSCSDSSMLYSDLSLANNGVRFDDESNNYNNVKHFGNSNSTNGYIFSDASNKNNNDGSANNFSTRRSIRMRMLSKQQQSSNNGSQPLDNPSASNNNTQNTKVKKSASFLPLSSNAPLDQIQSSANNNNALSHSSNFNNGKHTQNSMVPSTAPSVMISYEDLFGNFSSSAPPVLSRNSPIEGESNDTNIFLTSSSPVPVTQLSSIVSENDLLPAQQHQKLNELNLFFATSRDFRQFLHTARHSHFINNNTNNNPRLLQQNQRQEDNIISDTTSSSHKTFMHLINNPSALAAKLRTAAAASAAASISLGGPHAALILETALREGNMLGVSSNSSSWEVPTNQNVHPEEFKLRSNASDATFKVDSSVNIKDENQSSVNRVRVSKTSSTEASQDETPDSLPPPPASRFEFELLTVPVPRFSSTPAVARPSLPCSSVLCGCCLLPLCEPSPRAYRLNSLTPSVANSDDLILTCCDCNVRVHSSCYSLIYHQKDIKNSSTFLSSLVPFPSSVWKCQPCANSCSPLSVSCLSCSHRGGALKAVFSSVGQPSLPPPSEWSMSAYDALLSKMNDGQLLAGSSHAGLGGKTRVECIGWCHVFCGQVHPGLRIDESCPLLPLVVSDKMFLFVESARAFGRLSSVNEDDDEDEEEEDEDDVGRVVVEKKDDKQSSTIPTQFNSDLEELRDEGNIIHHSITSFDNLASSAMFSTKVVNDGLSPETTTITALRHEHSTPVALRSDKLEGKETATSNSSVVDSILRKQNQYICRKSPPVCELCACPAELWTQLVQCSYILPSGPQVDHKNRQTERSSSDKGEATSNSRFCNAESERCTSFIHPLCAMLAGCIVESSPTFVWGEEVESKGHCYQNTCNISVRCAKHSLMELADLSRKKKVISLSDIASDNHNHVLMHQQLHHRQPNTNRTNNNIIRQNEQIVNENSVDKRFFDSQSNLLTNPITLNKGGGRDDVDRDINETSSSNYAGNSATNNIKNFSSHQNVNDDLISQEGNENSFGIHPHDRNDLCLSIPASSCIDRIRTNSASSIIPFGMDILPSQYVGRRLHQINNRRRNILVDSVDGNADDFDQLTRLNSDAEDDLEVDDGDAIDVDENASIGGNQSNRIGENDFNENLASSNFSPESIKVDESSDDNNSMIANNNNNNDDDVNNNASLSPPNISSPSLSMNLNQSRRILISSSLTSKHSINKHRRNTPNSEINRQYRKANNMNSNTNKFFSFAVSPSLSFNTLSPPLQSQSLSRSQLDSFGDSNLLCSDETASDNKRDLTPSFLEVVLPSVMPVDLTNRAVGNSNSLLSKISPLINTAPSLLSDPNHRNNQDVENQIRIRSANSHSTSNFATNNCIPLDIQSNSKSNRFYPTGRVNTFSSPSIIPSSSPNIASSPMNEDEIEGSYNVNNISVDDLSSSLIGNSSVHRRNTSDSDGYMMLTSSSMVNSIHDEVRLGDGHKLRKDSGNSSSNFKERAKDKAHESSFDFQLL